MTSSLTFYTNPMSRGQIARWALHEAGADYDQQIVEYGPDMKAESYLAINPMGKVPALVHEGRTVTECAAICAYLAEAFPDAGLGPKENERADYFRWLFFAAGPLESAVTNNALGFNPADDQQMMAGYGSFERTLDVMAAKFAADDFVCGDRFTMADVYIGSQVIWGIQFKTMPERESLLAYSGRLQEREAYQAAKAIDAAMIPEATA